jgi:hypothetical protein
MMKIRIETSNFSNQKENHSCEIIDNSCGPESTVNDYIIIFMRALLGMSFFEDQISRGVIEIAEELKEERKSKKTTSTNLLDMFPDDLSAANEEFTAIEGDTNS